VGRGVFVGTGEGVGILTRSLPTEHPRLPANSITSNKLDNNFRLISKLGITLLVVGFLLGDLPRQFAKSKLSVLVRQ
jgi:hypothetical protein